MRPVSVEFIVSQYFAEMPTAGVAPSWTPNTDGWYVRLYGNYQPFGHAGMDFACPIGTRVYAMADGVVLYAGWSDNLPGTGSVRKWLLYAKFPGIVTVIQHNGWIGVYAHLSDNDMAPAGTKVKMGQLIALSGNTGGVAAHLHVEALVDLTYKTGGGLIYGRTDPRKFFNTGLAAQGVIITPVTTNTPEPEEIDMAAEGRIIAEINQETEWAHGRFKALESLLTQAVQMLSQIAPQFRFYKGPSEDTLFELEDGKLRGITKVEWLAKGGQAPYQLTQEEVDALPKVGN